MKTQHVFFVKKHNFNTISSLRNKNFEIFSIAPAQFLARETLYVTSSQTYSKFHLIGSFLDHSKGMMVIMGLVSSLFEYRLNIVFSVWGLGGHFESEAQASGSRWPRLFGPSANE